MAGGTQWSGPHAARTLIAALLPCLLSPVLHIQRTLYKSQEVKWDFQGHK